MSTGNEDIKAIQKITNILSALEEDEERDRVLRYVAAREGYHLVMITNPDEDQEPAPRVIHEGSGSGGHGSGGAIS